jgi:hypothetical protein
MTSSMQDCMIPASPKEQQLESQSNVEDGAKYQRRCKEEVKPPDAAGSSVPVVMTHECGVVRSKGVRNKNMYRLELIKPCRGRLPQMRCSCIPPGQRCMRRQTQG